MLKNSFPLEKTSDIAEANRAAWNVVTVKHRQIEFDKLVDTLTSIDGTCLSEIEFEYLIKTIGIEGKSIAQIACNNGQALLSLKKLGAGPCVGFDIADAAIDYARDLAEKTNIDCNFIRASIYDIDEIHDAQFDLVFISAGALGWFPDIETAFKKMAALLKPGGNILIHEIHPILDMFKPDNECTEEEKSSLQVEFSYFREQPFVTEGGLDYIGKSSYEAPPDYWFHHKMSDVIQAGISAGLTLRFFKELPNGISKSYERLNTHKELPPLSYVLRFTTFAPPIVTPPSLVSQHDDSVSLLKQPSYPKFN